MKYIFIFLSKTSVFILAFFLFILSYLQFFGNGFPLFDKSIDIYFSANQKGFEVMFYPKNQNLIISRINHESYKDGNKFTVYAKFRYFISDNESVDIENKTNKIQIELSDNDILNIYVLNDIFGQYTKRLFSEEISKSFIKNKLETLNKSNLIKKNIDNEMLIYQALSIPLRLSKIKSLLHIGDYTNALGEYEFLQKITINTNNYKRLFGDFQNLQGFSQIRDLEKQIQDFFPDKKEMYFDLGNAYYNLGNELYAQDNKMLNFDAIIYLYLKSVSYFDKAILLDKNFSDAYKMKGIVLMDIGVPVGVAQSALEKAIETNPNNAYAHYKLGNIYWQVDKSPEAYKKAMKAYSRAIAIEENEKYYFNLGSVQIKLGLISEGLDSRKKAYSICKESCNDILSTTLGNLATHNSFEELKKIAEKATLGTQDEKAFGFYYLSKYYTHTKQDKLSDFYLDKAYEAGIKKFLP